MCGAVPLPVRMRKAFPDWPRLIASEASFVAKSAGLENGLEEVNGGTKPKNDKNLEGANRRSQHAWKMANSVGFSKADSRLTTTSSLITFHVLAPSDFQKPTPKE